MSERKVIITGTGRAGTTLLVAMLSDLGADTGYRAGIAADTRAGGLETIITRPDAPRIVKAPGLSTRLRSLLESGAVEIEHAIIPMRDLDIASASRARVAGYGRYLGVRGGFTGTRSASRQRDVLAHMIYELVFTLTTFDIPYTFLAFPRFSYDWQYTYEKLGFLVPDKSVNDFRRVVEARYDATKIREEPLSTGERARAAALQPWTVVRRVAGRLPAKSVNGSGEVQARKPVEARDADPDLGPAADGSAETRTREPNPTHAPSPSGSRAGARGLLVTMSSPLRSSNAWRLWRARNLRRRAMGPLDGVRNEWSIISAPPARYAAPSDDLVAFALRAVQCAREVDLRAIHERRPASASRMTALSGQHYRILAGMAAAWPARRVVEIGTYLGASALAFLDVPAVEHVITYDIMQWDRFPTTYLVPDDFGPRLEQRIGDLSAPDFFAANAEDLADADLIFCDAPKDGVFEPAFLELLFATPPKRSQLLVLDDIRVLTMIRTWGGIEYDKLDLSSFGHWSGTGIVVRGPVPSPPVER